MSTVVQRVRLLAVCAGLTAVALQQAPRRIVGDTKVDLALDPLRFLGRVLHLWDPARDVGLTQNQSYGYLFPMGPFFALGRGIGMPPWLVQRLWWALLLCLACAGVVTLAERLGIGDEPARLVGGVAFALSPRILSTLGPISVESLPYCLAPWVLLPLVAPTSPRRAAARSGVAVLCMGAVNAAAVLAALPLAALWLLTRAPGPARRRLAGWWVLAVLLATCWWVAPLLLLGRYSPPFLGLIESATTTTSITSLVEVLRGTSDWVGYVGLPHGPAWPAAWTLVTRPGLIAYTVLVLAAAVAGLLRRDLPERRFLLLCLLAGVAAVTAGHVGPLDGPLAGELRDLLDGPLAPFRNVHKFDVVLRLPLVLGLVHLVARLRAAAATADRPDLLRPLVVLAAVAGVVGAALPVLTGLAPRGPFLAEPTWERQAAAYLRDTDDGGTALLVPGARAPDFVWGSPNDEPFQQLATTPWAVRSAVPLTPAGTIRVLDAVEEQLAAGVPSPRLAGFLARAGITRLVVRNDLDVAQADSTSPLLVHAALQGSRGLEPGPVFGAPVGGADDGVLADEGVRAYPAMEVWSVRPASPRLAVTPLKDVVRVAGGPESLLPLSGLLGGRPALLGTAGAGVLTDGLKRHEVTVGRSRQATSATLTAREPLRIGAPQSDYLPPGSAGRQTVARYVGARDVVASSSASDAGAAGGARPEHLPYAALDGDRATAWRADPFGGTTSSWTVLLDRPLPVAGLRVLLTPGSGTATVRTDAGEVPVRPGPLPVLLRGGTTSRITVRGAPVLGIADLRLPGLQVTRTLDTPAVDGSPTLVLSEAAGGRAGCVPDGRVVRCRQGSALGSEEPVRLDRTVHPGTPSQDALTVTAVARPGRDLDALLDRGTGATVTASSTAVDAPGSRPGTVLDGDVGTGWRARPGDTDPSLQVTWPALRRITAVTAVVGPLAASTPSAVTLVGDDGDEVPTTRLGASFYLGEPLVTRTLTVRFPHLGSFDEYARTRDPLTGRTDLLPVGVSELRFPGLTVPRPPAVLDLPCGSGPTVAVDGVLRRTRADAVPRAVLQLQQPFPAVPCDPAPVRVADGTRVVAQRSAVSRAVGVVLTPVGAPRPAARPLAGVRTPRWGATDRLVALPARTAPALLQVHENTNPGWTASLQGRRLRAVVVDGWQQGWVVPAGAAGQVRLVYGPDRLYRAALGLGVLPVLLLLVLAVRPGRPGPAAAPGGRLLPGVVGVGLLVLVGGLPAAALLLVAVLVPDRWRAAAAPVLLLAAGLLLARHPWTDPHYAGRGAAAQALCLAALAVVVASLLPTLGTRRSTGASRNR